MLKVYLAVLKGTAGFRFYFQPLMAIFRGVRDGKMDASNKRKPLLMRLLLGKKKLSTLKESTQSIKPVILLALVLDIYAQYQIFDHYDPSMTIAVIFIIVYCPYFIARDVTNRLLSNKR